MTRARTESGAATPRRGLLARFARDTRGGFATMLAITAIPMIAMAGIGVDVARVLSARTDLQAATDNAALALARQPYSGQQGAAGDASCPTAAPATFQGQACNWVLSNFSRSDVSNLTVAPTASSSQVTVAGAANVTTTLSGIMGVKTIHVVVSSTVNRNLTHVELALVLDNTGSMTESDGSGGTKAATLKTAATALVDTLSASAVTSGQTDAFKVAMVPFATYVNIKNLVGNKNPATDPAITAWMSGTSGYPNDFFNNKADRFALFSSLNTTWGGCVESRPAPYDAQDDSPNKVSPSTMFVPYFAPDEPDDTFVYNGTTYDSFYNNYLTDDNSSADMRTAMAGTNKYKSPLNTAGVSRHYSIWEAVGYTATNTRGPNKDCANVPLIPLTTDYLSVKSAINALAPAGNTHIPFGLVWGWHLLSPNMPFGSTTGYKAPGVYKIVVLVTDGSNTYNQGGDCAYASGMRCNDPMNNTLVSQTDASKQYINDGFYTGYGYPWQTRITNTSTRIDAAMNTRLTQLCSNMQAAGVILYTIPLLVTDPTTKAMLQGCASPSNVGPPGVKYLEAQTGAQLTQNFKNIAGQISALRVAK